MNGPYEWRDAPAAEFAVIGDPIMHSLSPKMHMAAFRVLNIPYRYIAVRVPRGEVGQALDRMAALGSRGVNVTVPHKEEALEWVREADDFAGRVRSVNTISPAERQGINTDGPGFLDTLEALGLPKGARVVVLGAGGSSRAICLSLHLAGYRVGLWNRTRERAEELVRLLDAPIEVFGQPDLSNADLIVNATSAGLAGSGLDLFWQDAPKGAIAYDLVYGQPSATFLAQARSHGLRTVDGLGLLVAQGARSLEWWLGVEAPRAAMLEAIR